MERICSKEIHPRSGRGRNISGSRDYPSAKEGRRHQPPRRNLSLPGYRAWRPTQAVQCHSRRTSCSCSTLSGELSERTIESILEEYLRAVQIASNPRLVDPSWQGEPAKFLELDDIVGDIVREREKKSLYGLIILRTCQERARRAIQRIQRPPLQVAKWIPPLAPQQWKRLRAPRKLPKILVAIPAAGGVGILHCCPDSGVSR